MVLIGLKVLVMNELTAKHYYFRCSRPPDVNGIKILYYIKLKSNLSVCLSDLSCVSIDRNETCSK